MPCYLAPIAAGMTQAICPPGARVVVRSRCHSGAVGRPRASSARRCRKVNFLTTNEKRAILGFEPTKEIPAGHAVDRHRSLAEARADRAGRTRQAAGRQAHAAVTAARCEREIDDDCSRQSIGNPATALNSIMSFVGHAVADAPDGLHRRHCLDAVDRSLWATRCWPARSTSRSSSKGLSGPRGIKLLASHNWDKPAGVIKQLKTVDDELKIEAQLNLNVSYVTRSHEVAKQNGGSEFLGRLHAGGVRFRRRETLPRTANI